LTWLIDNDGLVLVEAQFLDVFAGLEIPLWG
jgi:hypothetical protein